MNEAASTLTSKGLLKDYYDEDQGKSNPVGSVLKKKKDMMRDRLIDKLDLKPDEDKNG